MRSLCSSPPNCVKTHILRAYHRPKESEYWGRRDWKSAFQTVPRGFLGSEEFGKQCSGTGGSCWGHTRPCPWAVSCRGQQLPLLSLCFPRTLPPGGTWPRRSVCSMNELISGPRRIISSGKEQWPPAMPLMAGVGWQVFLRSLTKL